MKERPILYSAPMVRAKLAGTKTQTRRALKSQPADSAIMPRDWSDVLRRRKSPDIYGSDGLTWGNVPMRDGTWGDVRCPYGQPGDRLWGRETWGVISHAWDESGRRTSWTPDRPATAIHELPFGRGFYSGHVVYAADGPHEWAGDDDGDGEPRSAWHPSIHMPRAVSRLLDEIIGVRVERLQDISEADALAEGVRMAGDEPDMRWNPVQAYRHLWESINGPGSWDANPWVWVIEFKRVAQA